MIEWLQPYVSSKIDPGQFGGIKGNSITQYLMHLVNFILTNTDKGTIPKAVLIALCDYSKGFNRINHAKVIIRLSDWGAPGWILRILISYLSNRTMVLKYKGEVSSPQPLPGGTVQGSELGILLFIVELSDAGMDVPMQPQPIPNIVDITSWSHPTPAVTFNECRLKYIDDQTQAEVVHLERSLILEGNTVGPRDFHDRHGHILPPANSILQKRLNDINKYAEIHQLKINEKKTKIMAFNFSRKYDFSPKLSIADKELDVIYTTKLLGVVLTADCKWKENTKYIVSKASKRIWYLRRLKALGASITTLLEHYKKSIRLVLEFGAPLWTASLTKANIEDIEKVQKTSFKVIMGHNYSSYRRVLLFLEEVTLEERRMEMCKKYAKQQVKNPKMSMLFRKSNSITRQAKPYIEPMTRTKRAYDGCVPFLTRLLNGDT